MPLLLNIKTRFSSFFQQLFSANLETPEVLQKKYFPSLDGFRALSVLMVVTFHLYLPIQSPVYHSVTNGSLGVNIFFIISGFLITLLLMKEKAKTGVINLKNFYLRRVLRIFPAAYVYLIVLLVISISLNYKIDKVNFASCFLYLTNFSFLGNLHTNWATGHFWSLAVEEQFYLLFPFVIKKNFKLYIICLLLIIFILPLYFIAVANGLLRDIRIIYFFTHFLIKFQGIAIGSLTAILIFKKILNIDKLKINFILLAVINPALLFSIFSIGFNPNFSVEAVLKNEVISILVAILLILNIFQPQKNPFYKLLNAQPVKYIGVLSYSIYIWHFLFTDKAHKPFPEVFYSIPYTCILIFIAAFLSYNFLEKPFLLLKKKISSDKF